MTHAISRDPDVLFGIKVRDISTWRTYCHFPDKHRAAHIHVGMASLTDSPSQESALTPPIIVTPRCIIRRYHLSDIPAVAHHANNPKVARRLRPHFPSPYTYADAEEWCNRASAGERPLS